jgi:hypothetical protein
MEASVLAELTCKVVYQYEDDDSLERHTAQAEDLMRRALAGHAAMYDLEVTGRRAPIDNFSPDSPPA